MGMTAQDPGCCCASGYTCGSCAIPAEDLVVSWTNPIVGDGSATLVYSATGPTWSSGCVDQLIYTLSCASGVPVLTVYYFVAGSCPTGTIQHCATNGANPFKLTQTSLTCGSSFLMTVTLTSTTCPNLAAFGYTDFTVST